MKRFLTAAAIVAMAAVSVAPALAATTTTTTKTTTTTAMKPVAKPVAAPAAAKPVVLTFKLIDANHDGKISFEELKKYFPTLTKAEFAKYAGKDGSMDHAGLAAFFKAEKAMAAAAAKPAPAKPAMTTTKTTTTKTTTK